MQQLELNSKSDWFWHNSSKYIYFIHAMPISAYSTKEEDQEANNIENVMKNTWMEQTTIIRKQKYYYYHEAKRTTQYSTKHIINQREWRFGVGFGGHACLLADYFGNVYLVSYNPNTMLYIYNQCYANLQGISKYEQCMKAILFVNMLELGDVTQHIKWFIVNCKSNPAPSRFHSIDWHGQSNQ